MAPPWKLRPATAADAEWLVSLRAAVMRPDLERVGRWDPERSRRRFLGGYVPANTDVIELDGEPVGAIAVRPEADAQWIEHFYLAPHLHGRGIGGQVLRDVMAAHRDARPFRLVALRNSPALRLYARLGFVHAYDHENGIDQIFEAPGDGGYLLENAQPEAGERLRALAAVFNPPTFRRIESLGIEAGWSCWEVGAGGPSVPAWLAERVGPSGRVLATDIDVSWLTGSAADDHATPVATGQHALTAMGSAAPKSTGQAAPSAGGHAGAADGGRAAPDAAGEGHAAPDAAGEGHAAPGAAGGGRAAPGVAEVGAAAGAGARSPEGQLAARRGGFEVLCHDIGSDSPPNGQFDLVHARLVLVHVPNRDDALAAMVGALRSGGWLLVEEADPMLQPLACPDEAGPAQRLANRLRNDFRRLMAERGADLGYGRSLPRRLREAGLVDVGAEAHFPMAGAAGARLELATMVQLRGRLTAAGLATDDEIDQHMANVAAGRVDVSTAPMISAWGRAQPR